MHDWRDEIQLSETYSAYKDDFIVILLEFLAMWNGHQCQIKVAKQRIKLLEELAKTVHAALYRAGPKMREVEKVETKNAGQKRNRVGADLMSSTSSHRTQKRKVEVDEADRDERVFTSHDGLYWFIYKSFWVESTFGKFQSVMDVIPTDLIWQFASKYLDDIMNYINSPEKHIGNVCKASTLLNGADVTL